MSQCYVRNLNLGVGLIGAFLFKVKSFFFLHQCIDLDFGYPCQLLSTVLELLDLVYIKSQFYLEYSQCRYIVQFGIKQCLYLSYCTSTYIIAVRYIVCDFYRCDFHSTRLVCRKLSVLSITYSENTQNIIMILLFIFPDHMDFVSSSLFQDVNLQ